MKQKALVIALAASLASPAALAAGEHKVYGKVHVSIDSEELNVKVDEEGTSYVKEDRVNVKSNASRFGLKGNLPLTEGLDAIYKLEWQVDVADESKEKNISSRNQYGGLKGGFGSAIAGRHDTPLKMSQGKYDLFNDTFGDIKILMAGENRASNMAMYGLPGSLGNFKGYGQWYTSEDSSASFSDNSNWSFMGAYKADAFYGALAYNTYGGSEDSSMWRLTGIVPIGSFGIGAMYNSAKPDTGDTQDAWSANAYWKVGNGKLKLQYIDSDGQTVGKSAVIEEGGKIVSFGYNHNLGKKTYVYADYHALELDNPLKNDVSVFSLGFVTKFGGKLM